jgi:ABC-2 type transport system permease protein
MSALLKAELLKLRTTRTFAALACVALFTSGLLAVLVACLTEPTRKSVLIDVYVSDTSGIFILILAVVGITGEWRHRTITGSLLAAPDRLRFLASKTLAFAAAGVVLSVLVSIAVAILASAVLLFRDLPLPGAGELIVQDLRNALVAALLGALGVGLGALVRNQVVAVVGLLLLTLAIEPTLQGLVPNVGRFGPFSSLPTAAENVPADAAGIADIDLLSPGLAVLALLGWIGAAFATSAALLRRRDLT